MSRTSPGASPPARTVGEALPEAATDWAERRTKAVHLLALGALRHARQRAAAQEAAKREESIDRDALDSGAE